MGWIRPLAWSLALLCTLTAGAVARGQQASVARPATGESELHRAARQGDVSRLRTLAHQGGDLDARDANGRTALLAAVAAGRSEAVDELIRDGAGVDVAGPGGRTPLIEAAERGQLDSVRLLVRAGADLRAHASGVGSPLDAADRSGNVEVANVLRRAGARSATGKSVGDTVCVRPWGGDGYCGTVESVSKIQYRIQITQLVGCTQGCAPRAECSANRSVGGPGGLAVGDEVDTVSTCLTHTGVKGVTP